MRQKIRRIEGTYRTDIQQETASGRYSQDGATGGHRIYAARVVKVAPSGRYQVEVFGGYNLESKNLTIRSCKVLGDATFSVGDYVTVRIAPGEANLIISTPADDDSDAAALQQHSHSGPSDGGYIAGFTGTY